MRREVRHRPLRLLRRRSLRHRPQRLLMMRTFFVSFEFGCGPRRGSVILDLRLCLSLFLEIPAIDLGSLRLLRFPAMLGGFRRRPMAVLGQFETSVALDFEFYPIRFSKNLDSRLDSLPIDALANPRLKEGSMYCFGVAEASTGEK